MKTASYDLLTIIRTVTACFHTVSEMCVITLALPARTQQVRTGATNMNINLLALRVFFLSMSRYAGLRSGAA